MPNLCENCAAPMQGDFCSRCGQSVTDYNVPVTEFAKELANEAFSLDSRLRLTLKPLFFEPGAVPRDYVAGHRARFVPPIRLFVFASFAMFITLSVGSGVTIDNVTVNGVPVSDTAQISDSIPAESDAITRPEASTGNESSDTNVRSFGQRMQDQIVRGMERVDEDPDAFSRDFFDRFSQAMFFLLPVFAALLKLVHFRRLYVHHLVFSVYLHSFVFLVVALINLPDAVRLNGVSQWLAIGIISVPLYLLLGMKRFYGDGWAKTLAKFVFVSMAYALALGATTLVVLFLSLTAG